MFCGLKANSKIYWGCAVGFNNFLSPSKIKILNQRMYLKYDWFVSVFLSFSSMKADVNEIKYILIIHRKKHSKI